MEHKDINKEQTISYIDSHFDSWFVKALSDFVRVKNLTPMVDPNYLSNGLVEEAIDLVDRYIKELNITGISSKKFQPAGKAPLIVYVVEPSEGATKNVMMYGHLDKQPYGAGWREGITPTDPVIEGDYLYGRGSSDDGYSPFLCLLAVKTAQQQGVKLPRIALVLETEEESGSPNLLALLEEAKDFIGKPDYCLCMDSGALNYDQLWLTSSLRGICIVDVEVQVARDGYHSGEASGIIPETFRIVRQLLNRLDDVNTGKVIDELHIEIPERARKEAKDLVAAFGSTFYDQKFHLVDGLKVVDQDNLEEVYLNNTWRPQLSITGADGLPPIAQAGNVLRSKTSVRVSMRLPPGFDAHKANEILNEKLSKDVPYGAKVTLNGGHAGSGWAQKDLEPLLQGAIEKAAVDFYGKPVGAYGLGGSIPFLKELEIKYPDTQIISLGVLGPNSNAHGPNESINLPYVRKLGYSLTHIVAALGSQ